MDPASAIIVQMTSFIRNSRLIALALALSTPLGAILSAETATAAHERWAPDAAVRSNYAPSLAADRRISLEQAIDSVQRATGGRVLDAKDAGGQYRIKVLTRRGEVRVVYVDARTGAMSD